MENTVRFAWEPKTDEYYKERIKVLEKENARLRRMINDADMGSVAAEMSTSYMQNKLAQKDAKIAELERALLNVTLGWKGGAV